MLAGIREILVITTPEDQSAFQRLLGTGKELGIDLQFAIQPKAEGLAQAFIIGSNFINDGKVALILGDNIFHGAGLGSQLQTMKDVVGAQIFAYKVNDPENYGVAEFNSEGEVISLEEKPLSPKSQYAVPGLYFYDNSVVDIAKGITKSHRGELEITSVNQYYLADSMLNVTVLKRGTAWLDTGTIESFHAASSYVKVMEERQGNKISCLEEIAWRNGWISQEQLQELSTRYGASPYARYLRALTIEG